MGIRPARVLICSCIAVLLTSCSSIKNRYFQLPLKTEQLFVDVYDRGGPTESGTIRATTPDFDEILSIVESPKRRWSPSVITLLPDILIQGQTFVLNLGKTYVTIDGRTPPAQPDHQVVSSLTEEEYLRVRTIAMDALRDQRR